MSQVEDTTGEVQDTPDEATAGLRVPETKEADSAPAPSHDDAVSEPEEATPPAGESGAAGDDDGPGAPSRGDGAEVIIGEIPDIHDLSVMKWTARCSIPSHDLLGHYDSREQATQAKDEHLAAMHTGIADRETSVPGKADQTIR